MNTRSFAKNFFALTTLIFLSVGCTSKPATRVSTEQASVAAVVVGDEMTVISWNIKKMGRAKLDVDAAAEMLTRADIVTFQEVNNKIAGEEALNKIADRISRDSQTKICRALSAKPSGERVERYAYIWRNDRIAYVRTDGVVLEDCPQTALTIRLGVKNADRIVREPAFGTFLFKRNRSKFVLASVHLVPTKKKPEREIAPLFDTFADLNQPIIVAGDYNLAPSESAFDVALSAGFAPAFTTEKTSLRQNSRSLSQAYDNFWFRSVQLKTMKVLNLYEHFPTRDQRDIYNNISDHNPIQAVFVLSGE